MFSSSSSSKPYKPFMFSKSTGTSDDKPVLPATTRSTPPPHKHSSSAEVSEERHKHSSSEEVSELLASCKAVLANTQAQQSKMDNTVASLKEIETRVTQAIGQLVLAALTTDKDLKVKAEELTNLVSGVLDENIRLARQAYGGVSESVAPTHTNKRKTEAKDKTTKTTTTTMKKKQKTTAGKKPALTRRETTGVHKNKARVVSTHNNNNNSDDDDDDASTPPGSGDDTWNEPLANTQVVDEEPPPPPTTLLSDAEREELIALGLAVQQEEEEQQKKAQ